MKLNISEGDSFMPKHRSRSQGFVLIAALILLFLLSGIAVGLLMLTNSEQHVSGNDRESNNAFYAAESGMEKLTVDLAALYQSKQNPTQADLDALTTAPPTSSMVGPVTYSELVTRPIDPVTLQPAKRWNVISSGSNAGLTAEIIPITLQVNASRGSGADANMTRNVEVALIPVFQFGVFSDSDLSYFNGPPFQFAGRVHTNGNLYPTPGGTLIFGDKITAVGEIVRDRLANGYDSSTNYNSGVWAPNASGGCDTAIAANAANPGSAVLPSANCRALTTALASHTGGIPTAGTDQNPDWKTPFNTFVGNKRLSGVKPLILPFVAGGGDQIEIVRKPTQTESQSSALFLTRLYTKANIRILLADSIADLHPERSLTALADGEDIDLGAAFGTVFNVTGAPGGKTAAGLGDNSVDPNWNAPLPAANTAVFPLNTGFLRVEYQDAAGAWHGVTSEWLGLGFARNVWPVPTTANPDPINPKAILHLQEFADRSCPAAKPLCGPTKAAINDTPNFAISAASVIVPTNFLPINFYDAREGEVRDNPRTGVASVLGTTNGIMNAIELDEGNLKAWLNGTTGANGTKVDPSKPNGYLLYFSDRRGMQPDPHSIPVVNKLSGKYGFEDVVNNATSTVGTPDGLMDVGEDLDSNGHILDTWGATDVGNGFRLATNVLPYDPYQLLNCVSAGRMNKVTGARHVLRLTNASRGNLPFVTNTDGTIGGFTVASENPVYVLGDYNASLADGAFVDGGHVPAAIIADAVTLLSNPPTANPILTANTPGWDDEIAMINPSGRAQRKARETYYRMAIAAGKSLTFFNSFAAPANAKDWGTDGGVHNFLRYLEDWGWGGGVKLHYTGSLVSLYYSQYATGSFKCCNTVYGAPNRQYAFDQLFLDPTKLPPGTPEFQDVVNLTYRQDFTPQ